MSKYLVNLKKGNDYLVPQVYYGIDTSNLLATRTTGGFNSFTATQDCFIVGMYQGGCSTFTIDGISVLVENNDAVAPYLPLKKGQTINVGSNNARFKVFGIKY